MIRFDATGQGPWTSGQLGKADLTTSPQAQQHQQKRSIRVLHNPDNLISYRHTLDSGTKPRNTDATEMPDVRCTRRANVPVAAHGRLIYGSG